MRLPCGRCQLYRWSHRVRQTRPRGGARTLADGASQAGRRLAGGGLPGAYHKDGSTTLRVQLKGRAEISKKYQGKDLYLAFPVDGRWYLLPHDELVNIAAETTSWLQTSSWIEHGLYNVARPSRRMLDRLSDHTL